MRKLRSDSTFNGLPAAQREQVLNWLFDEGLNYAAAAKRVKEEFGMAVSVASVGRFYRRVAEDRNVAELAEAGGSVQNYRRAVRKILGMATLNVCIHNNESGPGGDGWKGMVALVKLMMKDEQREMKEKKQELELQRLGLRS